jgi:hypothetical protein
MNEFYISGRASRIQSRPLFPANPQQTGFIRRALEVVHRLFAVTSDGLDLSYAIVRFHTPKCTLASLLMYHMIDITINKRVEAEEKTDHEQSDRPFS